MGKSGKFAAITGIVAAGLLVLTGMTLAEPVFVAFLGVLALACLACLIEILNRGRRVALLAAGTGISFTVASSLAFVSTWELAFAGEPSFFGTPLPTSDPDNYFFGAAASALATLCVLFLGATWPRGRQLGTAVGKGRAGRGAAGNRRRTTAGGPAAKGTAQRRPAARTGGTSARGAGGGGTGSKGAGGLRAPARVPSATAKRPSSAAQGRKPSSATGAKAAPRR